MCKFNVLRAVGQLTEQGGSAAFPFLPGLHFQSADRNIGFPCAGIAPRHAGRNAGALNDHLADSPFRVDDTIKNPAFVHNRRAQPDPGMEIEQLMLPPVAAGPIFAKQRGIGSIIQTHRHIKKLFQPFFDRHL
ncbi:hypothetical protein D3C74_414120 [compost metagenome]